MKQKSLANNQAGAISLYVSLFVMAILVLMSLSFARIIRTGHSETVESQLNLKAYSAAETGINDAKARLVGMLDSFNRGLRNDAPKVLEKWPVADSPVGSSLPANARFGEVLDIDGDRAAVLVYNRSSAPPAGSIEFYEWDGSAWNLVPATTTSAFRQRIVPGTTYGLDIEIEGDCAFVGIADYGSTVGRVVSFKYDETLTTWGQLSGSDGYVSGNSGNNSFGASISATSTNSLAGKGSIAVGSPGINTDDGRVEVFDYDLSSCKVEDANSYYNYNRTSTHRLSPPVANNAGKFGASVTLNGHNILVIGEPENGAGAFYAHQYELPVLPANPVGAWTNRPLGEKQGSSASSTPFPAPSSGFATKVALSDNNFLAVSVDAETPIPANAKGQVRIYEYDGATADWVEVFVEEGDAVGDWRGVDIAINNKYLAVGAANAGTKGGVRVFEYSARTGWGDLNTWPLPYNELSQATPSAPGCSDGSSSDRQTCEDAGNSWGKPAGPLIVGAAAGDEYGYAVAFGRDGTLLVGVPGANSDRGVARVIGVVPDPHFNRDTLLEDMIEINCLSKETDSSNLYNYDIEDDGHVKYSCLGIDLRPDLLYFDKVYNDRSLNILLRSIEKDPNSAYEYELMKHLDIEWANLNKSSSPNFSTTSHYPNFPKHDDWNYDASVLRIQATPLDVGCISGSGSCERMDRNMIEDNTKVFYLYPASGSATGTTVKDWEDIDDGEIIEVNCGINISSPDSCVFSIQTLPKRSGQLNYNYVGADNTGTDDEEVAVFLRVTSIYDTSSLSLRGYNDNVPRWKDPLNPNVPSSLPGGCPTDEDDCRVEFKDIQAVISATGHAGHVRVRLEERVRLQSIYDQPEYAVHSASSLCKILIGDQDLGTTVGGRDYQLLVDSSSHLTGLNVNQHCKVY